MNKVISREMRVTGAEAQKAVNRDGDTVEYVGTRKRWYLTMECCSCLKVFTIREKPKNASLAEPCETCRKRPYWYGRFVDKALKKHGDTFSYEHVTAENYLKDSSHVPIVCKIHGVFWQQPKDHLSKTNGKICCPECIVEFNKLHNKRSIESWKLELQERFPGFVITSHGNSDSNLEKCTIDCPTHGEFETTLASIKSTMYLCASCAFEEQSWGARTKRTDIPGTLYFLKFTALGIYKLGVTSKTVADRFRQEPEPYEILWELGFDTLASAYEAETQAFRDYREFRRCRNAPRLLQKGGYTELLTCFIPKNAIRTSNCTSKEP